MRELPVTCGYVLNTGYSAVCWKTALMRSHCPQSSWVCERVASDVGLCVEQWLQCSLLSTQLSGACEKVASDVWLCAEHW